MQHFFIAFFDEIFPPLVLNTETPEPLEGDSRQRLGEDICQIKISWATRAPRPPPRLVPQTSKVEAHVNVLAPAGRAAFILSNLRT